MKKYQGKRVLIVGLGVSGCSAAQFLLDQGASVIGVDDNLARIDFPSRLASLLDSGLQVMERWDEESCRSIDLIVSSPGIPPSHPILVRGKEKEIEIIGEVELACRTIEGRCVGITGTNGKTTVTFLIEHILTHCGKKAKAVGNIGVPLTSELRNSQYEFFVIELSSYQLETLSAKVLDCAVILNITPDHLNRYAGMEAYIAAKLQIVEALKSGGRCFMHEEVIDYAKGNPQVVAYGSKPGTPVRLACGAFFEEGAKVLDLTPQLCSLPQHDLLNLLAAYGVCRDFGIDNAQFLEGAATFQKPPHRIEFIRTIGGVKYFNDSKGTNVDAVVKAVQAVQGNVVLIAGGVDKGSPFSPWIDAFRGKVKCLFAIGEAAGKLERELGQAIPVELCEDLLEAVTRAKQSALPGDNILLSPGCASYDMFRDYEHRGEEFKRIVFGI